jgi:hypothetical protein
VTGRGFRRYVVACPADDLLEFCDDIRKVLGAMADWAEGYPEIRLPRSLGHTPAHTIWAATDALRDAWFPTLHAPDGAGLHRLAVVEFHPDNIRRIGRAASALARLADGHYPSVAAAIEEYRLYWFCPPETVLADVADELHRIWDQPWNADHDLIAARLDPTHQRADRPNGAVVLTAVETAAHRRIIDRLTSHRDEPTPTMPTPPTRRTGDGCR